MKRIFINLVIAAPSAIAVYFGGYPALGWFVLGGLSFATYIFTDTHKS